MGLSRSTWATAISIGQYKGLSSNRTAIRIQAHSPEVNAFFGPQFTAATGWPKTKVFGPNYRGEGLSSR
jgi:hypothetical protein